MPSIFGFAASKQPVRRRRTRRLVLEGLEDRALMSITSTIDITSIAQNSETGQNHTDESMSSGGSTSATWTSGSDSVSAHASGSVTTDGLSLSGSASNSTDEQGSGHPYMAGVASVYFYTTITVATRSTVYFDLTPQFSHSPDHTARGGLSLIRYGSSTQELLDVVDRDLDGLSGSHITRVLDLTAGTYTFRTAIYSVAEKNAAPTGPQSSSLGLNIIEVPLTAPTTTTLTIAPNPAVYGQPVTLSATVAANGSGLPAPTGKVTFLDGSDTIGLGDIDASGKVSVTIPKLAFGTHLITAVYGGDANNDPSTSQTLPMAVNPLVSLDQLKTIMKSLTSSDVQRYLQPLNDALAEFEINTPKRIAAFLGQVAVETGDLSRWTELGPKQSNLQSGYRLPFNRRPALTTTLTNSADWYEYWYGPWTGFDPYPNDPSKTYAAPATTLGNTQTGDGYRFIGRGPLQLTGRAHYQEAADYFDLPLLTAIGPDGDAARAQLADSSHPAIGLRVAAWFWQSQGLNAKADSIDASKPLLTGPNASIINRISIIISGGADIDKRRSKTSDAFKTLYTNQG